MQEHTGKRESNSGYMNKKTDATARAWTAPSPVQPHLLMSSMQYQAHELAQYCVQPHVSLWTILHLKRSIASSSANIGTIRRHSSSPESTLINKHLMARVLLVPSIFSMSKSAMW
jgi:hypothetical protein